MRGRGARPALLLDRSAGSPEIEEDELCCSSQHIGEEMTEESPTPEARQRRDRSMMYRKSSAEGLLERTPTNEAAGVNPQGWPGECTLVPSVFSVGADSGAASAEWSVRDLLPQLLGVVSQQCPGGIRAHGVYPLRVWNV